MLNLKDSTALTIRSMANSLIPKEGRKDLNDFFVWPADLFALTSSILSITGVYKNVLLRSNNSFHWPPKGSSEANWSDHVTFIGQKWRMEFDRLNKDNILCTGNDEIQKCGVLEIPITLSADEKDNRVRNAFDIKKVNFVSIAELNELRKTLNDKLDFKIYGLRLTKEELNSSEPTDSCKEHFELFRVIMTLHAIADEFAAGFCIRSNLTLQLERYEGFNNNKGVMSLGYAEALAKTLMTHNNSLSRINSERCKIPKRQTPHTGITLRSISGNLAYHRSSVKVIWNFYSNKKNSLFTKLQSATVEGDGQQKKNLSALNILLIPWPFELKITDLKKINLPKESGEESKHEYFIYQPKEYEDRSLMISVRSKFKDEITQLVIDAKNESGGIDIIVFPESALNIELRIALVEICLENDISGYVCGCLDSSSADNDDPNQGCDRLGSNSVQTHFFDWNRDITKQNIEMLKKLNSSHKPKRISKKIYAKISENAVTQHKHHRWKLSPYQIKKYNLGGALSVSKNWWEGIHVEDREINFFNLGEELTMCSLICEDLARQDPIADLLRSVGPNLVITLLMDGEQLKHRWSSRYASILSDDPGSAVITLTSLGMVKRDNDVLRKDSLSIGMVSDSKGNFNEIRLAHGKKAALVTLNLNPVHENLADRQNSFCYTNHLTLGGIHYI
jgi:hypothetical protein